MKPKNVACVEERTFFVVDVIRVSIVNMVYHNGINSTKKVELRTYLESNLDIAVVHTEVQTVYSHLRVSER
jgi:hypothetical protein